MALEWFMAAPDFWLTLAFTVCLVVGGLVAMGWAWLRWQVGMWRHRRSAVPKRIVMVLAAMLVSGCATTYRPAGGEGPFAFTLAPEQCQSLSKERRTYRATEATSTYVAGGSALLTGLLVGFLDSRTAPAVASGATLAASSVAMFSGSQVSSLDAELAAGGCSR